MGKNLVLNSPDKIIPQKPLEAFSIFAWAALEPFGRRFARSLAGAGQGRFCAAVTRPGVVVSRRLTWLFTGGCWVRNVQECSAEGTDSAVGWLDARPLIRGPGARSTCRQRGRGQADARDGLFAPLAPGPGDSSLLRVLGCLVTAFHVAVEVRQSRETKFILRGQKSVPRLQLGATGRGEVADDLSAAAVPNGTNLCQTLSSKASQIINASQKDRQTERRQGKREMRA